MNRAPAPAHTEIAPPNIRRILCAVTFSPAARLIVEQAAWLATTFDAEIRLFHVLDQRANDTAIPAFDAADESDVVLTKLFQIARPLPRRARLSAAVTEGDPAEEILRHARLIHADLIVLGMAGKASIESLIAQIATAAHCPVLLIPQWPVARTTNDRFDDESITAKEEK